MNALDNIKAALEAGPTEGPWEYEQDDNLILSNDGKRLVTYSPRSVDVSIEERKANGQLIAACNPSSIRELLAYVESLEKDAARYRWLREQFRCMSVDMGGQHRWILSPSGGLRGPDVDDAIDAAMEQTK